MDQKWEDKLNAGRMAIKSRAKQAREVEKNAASREAAMARLAANSANVRMAAVHRRYQVENPRSAYWQTIGAGYAQAVWNGHGLVHTDVG